MTLTLTKHTMTTLMSVNEHIPDLHTEHIATIYNELDVNELEWFLVVVGNLMNQEKLTELTENKIKKEMVTLTN